MTSTTSPKNSLSVPRISVVAAIDNDPKEPRSPTISCCRLQNGIRGVIVTEAILILITCVTLGVRIWQGFVLAAFGYALVALDILTAVLLSFSLSPLPVRNWSLLPYLIWKLIEVVLYIGAFIWILINLLNLRPKRSNAFGGKSVYDDYQNQWFRSSVVGLIGIICWVLIYCYSYTVVKSWRKYYLEYRRFSQYQNKMSRAGSVSSRQLADRVSSSYNNSRANSYGTENGTEIRQSTSAAASAALGDARHSAAKSRPTKYPSPFNRRKVADLNSSLNSSVVGKEGTLSEDEIWDLNKQPGSILHRNSIAHHEQTQGGKRRPLSSISKYRRQSRHRQLPPLGLDVERLESDER